jgi:hypothetical protein
MFPDFFGSWLNLWGMFIAGYVTPYRDEIVAIATIFLTIFTMVLSFVAYRQNKMARIVERAYASINPLGIETFRTKDSVIALIAIKNSGRLPARKISWILRCDWSADRERKRFSPIKREDFVGDNILASGGEIIKGTGPIPIGKFPKIISDTPQIYVWGAIRYHSGFGYRRKTLRFCHRYDVSGVVPDDAGSYRVPATEGRHHEYGNNSN